MPTSPPSCDPLPVYAWRQGRQESETAGDYPLVLTAFSTSSSTSSTATPRLRDQEREPFIEIHPDTAVGLDVVDGEWADGRDRHRQD
jgi:anaerobic selenocysteine-containing dehydrogenase